jgi:hypothetical protein
MCAVDDEPDSAKLISLVATAATGVDAKYTQRESTMPETSSVMTYLETLVRQTHKSEAEILTLAFQTGLRQLWREHFFGLYRGHSGANYRS